MKRRLGPIYSSNHLFKKTKLEVKDTFGHQVDHIRTNRLITSDGKTLWVSGYWMATECKTYGDMIDEEGRIVLQYTAAELRPVLRVIHYPGNKTDVLPTKNFGKFIEICQYLNCLPNSTILKTHLVTVYPMDTIDMIEFVLKKDKRVIPQGLESICSGWVYNNRVPASMIKQFPSSFIAKCMLSGRAFHQLQLVAKRGECERMKVQLEESIKVQNLLANRLAIIRDIMNDSTKGNKKKFYYIKKELRNVPADIV